MIKNFFIILLLTTIAFAETHWYEFHNEGQRIGYGVAKISKDGQYYKYVEKVYLFNIDSFTLVESSVSKLDSEYRLINMKQQRGAETFKYKVDRNKEVVVVTSSKGKVTLPFSHTVYPSFHCKQLKSLGLLKKGAQATIQIVDLGKLETLKMRTTKRGTLSYNGKKVKVYVVYVTSEKIRGKLYASSSNKVYKMKVGNLMMRKVSKEEATRKRNQEISSQEETSVNTPSNTIWDKEGQGDPGLIAVGKRVESAVSAGQGTYLNDLLNADAFINTIANNVGIQPHEKDMFTQQIVSNFPLGTQIASVVQQGAGYEFLHTSSDGLLFRLKTPQGAINYHHFKMSKVNGQWKYNDIYIYVAGENISTTMSSGISLATGKTGFFDRLFGGKGDGEKFLSMALASRRGQFYQVLQHYNGLSAKGKKIKAVLILRCRAAQQISMAEYEKAVNDYMKSYSGDASANLFGIDYFTFKKDYPKVLECVDKLDQEVKDPYLDLYRANVSLLQEKYSEAKKYMSRLGKNRPNDKDSYFSLIDIALKERDYAEVTRVMIFLERNLGVEWQNLEAVPGYEGYVASPEYSKFLNRR